MDQFGGNAAQFGAQVRKARKARGWSIRATAAKLGLSVRFLNELERGKATVRLDKVMQALDGLGLELTVVPKGAGLRDQVMARRPLLRSIAAAHGVRALSLFGSVARGKEEAKSDLDFLVELEDGRSLLDLVGVKQDLEALFGRPVDAFTPDSLKPGVLTTARADLVSVL